MKWLDAWRARTYAGERLAEVITGVGCVLGGALVVTVATWALHWILAWSWWARLGLVLGVAALVLGVRFVRFLTRPETYR